MSTVRPWKACTVEAQAWSRWRSCGSLLPSSSRPAVAEPEGNPVAPDRRHFRRVAVDQPEAGVVTGPADAIAGADLHALGAVDLDRAALRTDPARPPGDGLSVQPLQHHRAPGPVDPGDAALVALRNAEAAIVPVEGDDIAGDIVRGNHLLGTCITVGDQPLGLISGAADDAVAGRGARGCVR